MTQFVMHPSRLFDMRDILMKFHGVDSKSKAARLLDQGVQVDGEDWKLCKTLDGLGEYEVLLEMNTPLAITFGRSRKLCTIEDSSCATITISTEA